MAKAKVQKTPVKQATFRSELDDHPVRNCMLVTVIAAGCVVAGFYMKNPLLMVLGLLPVALFEAYRTWGPFTKFASWLFLLTLIAESVLIVMKFNFDLVRFTGGVNRHFAGYNLQLTDIKAAIPLILALLSFILVLRTAGTYTKWLALVITAGCICIVLVLAPKQFPELVHWIVTGFKNFFHHFAK
jgi:hypothetical protein